MRGDARVMNKMCEIMEIYLPFYVILRCTFAMLTARHSISIQ